MNIFCNKCSKLVMTLKNGSKTRDGYVVFCSDRCAGPVEPTREFPDFLAALFKNGGK